MPPIINTFGGNPSVIWIMMQMTKILRGEQNIVARFICLRLWNKFALKYDDCVDIKGVAWSTIALYKSPAVAIMQFRILAAGLLTSLSHSITTWTMHCNGGWGQKMSVFVHAQGIKTVHAGGGGLKMAKFCPRSCWMTP